MDNPLQASLAELTCVQRQAVDWEDGPLLVLAGPGSGKTRVLTCRIARLLDSSPDRRFRILALTFTNKAANEMAARVAALVPGLEGRASIRTLHAFCAQVLRQHGVHLGIKPDFAIYSRTEDRLAVLEDALSHDPGQDWRHENLRLLPLIDHLKTRLVEPESAEEYIGAMNGPAAEDPGRVARAYRLYEEELRRINALDFDSLILDTYRLFAYPAMARQYRRAYRYWLIDEFQDTNGAQYKLLRRMAGQDFREIFAVADDDQTIFEWNGANVRRIRELVKDFSCSVVQLPTNFRCPPRIVEAANRLVVYNSRRVASKQPAMPASVPGNSPASDQGQVQCREFDTDSREVAGIADEIACLDAAARGRTAVLARTRFLLEAMHNALKRKGVPAVIAMRHGDFLSPQMRWLVACLKQIDRPLDRRNMAVLVEAFGRFAPSPLDLDELASRSESDRLTCLKVWTDAVREAGMPHLVAEMVNVIADLSDGKIKLTDAIKRIFEHFDSNDPDDDLKYDLSAWRRIQREIEDAQEFVSLDRFLQELQLRTKEPVAASGTVSLTTIHGAKGQEFETVYLIGLAEEILPSWHSLKRGADSAALEEERRGCFVAVTRTRRHLILSRARHYRGRSKKPSRFLEEMGCLGDHGADTATRRTG